MNYRNASTEQLRKERVRLTNMQQVLQHRVDSARSNRGGRNAGFRRGGSTNHQQERDLQQLIAQIAELDAELVRRDQAEQPDQPNADVTSAPSEAEG
jgi:hypothetical protein